MRLFAPTGPFASFEKEREKSMIKWRKLKLKIMKMQSRKDCASHPEGRKLNLTSHNAKHRGLTCTSTFI